MNTTTNTRGVSEAMVERACEASWPIAKFSCELSDWKQIGSGPRREHHTNVVRAAVESALSAPEPAAQGEAVHQYRHKGSSDWYDGVLAEPDAEFETRTLYTAPPAQPAERDSQIIGADSQVKPAERVPEGCVAVRRSMLAETVRVLKDVDTQFRATGQPSGQVERLVNFLAPFAASPAPSPARVDGGEG